VIDTNTLASTLQAMPGTISRTSLGGFRWKTPEAEIPLDLWQLKDTVWIRERGLAPTITSFLAGVDLDIDRIAIGLHDGAVFGDDCYRAILEKRISLDAVYHLEALATDEYARALMARYKTGYALSDDLHVSIFRTDYSALAKRAFERLGADGYSVDDIAMALEYTLA
jgi:hypothetical protein